MTPPAFTEIDSSCISPVSLANGKIQPIDCFRHHDQMNMVWLQAIRPGLHVLFHTILTLISYRYDNLHY